MKREIRMAVYVGALSVCVPLIGFGGEGQQVADATGEAKRASPERGFDCGYRSPAYWTEELHRATVAGEIADPRTRRIPAIPSRPRTDRLKAIGTLANDDIFAFEDTAQLLLTNFSDAQLIDLMTDAANDLMATHGDLFDFVGFWTNFTPDHLIGAAFYLPIANDVAGIGDPSTVGTPIFDSKPTMGLGGVNIEGFVMMWEVNNSIWQTGTGPEADFTRLALGQEFEHRFALFLPDLLDGRVLQGDDDICGRTFHWNWKIDGQGSSMEISEWIGGVIQTGSAPNVSWRSKSFAFPVGTFVNFNVDNGGVFSYSDLYLMGYVSDVEMDAGNSQLRFMDDSDCSSPYSGKVTNFSSADIIAAAGPRVPDSTTEDKDYRTGWIMIHLPGSPPTTTQLDKAVAILEQHEVDWNTGTLGLGTMDNSLP